VLKRGWTLAEPVALADGPNGRSPGSLVMIRELVSLGLTKETSMGILRVLSGPRTAPAADPCEW
jgi:hypothetical protein